jgi:hypothetical protein
MNNQPIIPGPFEGKTYTLYGRNRTSSRYYQIIAGLADQVLEKNSNLRDVILALQKFSRKKRVLEKKSNAMEDSTLLSYLMHLLNEPLNEFTEKADKHVKNLMFTQLWDRRLGTTRKQYHLYMLEIELTNRINSEKFRDAEKKIALLPYCLRDFKVVCRAAPDHFDYQCRHCSANCYQNRLSRFLLENQIDAYIWMGADIKKNTSQWTEDHKKAGILGIACIPELVWGMRKCQKYNIPVVGLPLDANRCMRWMGNFNENSVNFEMLEKLVRRDVHAINP